MFSDLWVINAKMRRIGICLILFALFALGLGLRSNYRFSRKYSTGERIRIKGLLPEQPYHNRSTQVFTINNIKVVTGLFPAYNYGDWLEIEGVLMEDKYSSLSKRSNKMFRLLMGEENDLVLIYPSITLVENGSTRGNNSGFDAMLALVKLRQDLMHTYQKILPRPHSSLLAGIVLGQKMSMDEGFYELLVQTGTLHIIVASGMNVAIVAGVIVNLLILFMRRRRAVLVAILGVVGYVLLAGASAPVVRAGIMGGLTFLAVLVGREKDGFRVLMFTGIVMLLWNPRYLIDIGWQLSFVATTGILVGAKGVERYVLKVSDRLSWVATEIGVTVAAQIATAPLIYYYFGNFSWASPIVNVLLAPVVPVITILGMLVGVVGLLWLDLAKVLGWGIWVFLEYFVLIVSSSRMFG